MTAAPLPLFLTSDTLDEFERLDGYLTYLVPPLGHQDASVRENRFESASTYCGYLTRERKLVILPLSLRASLDKTDISKCIW